MSARVTQSVIETIYRGLSFVRLSQYAFEVIISDIVTPAKSRVTQYAVEVIITSPAAPATTTRYGPRIQSV